MASGEVLCFEVTGDATEVHAWSSRRLPFEPKGDTLAYRDEIRTALRSLHPRPGEGLVATYQSPDDDFVEVENAALYNVGALGDRPGRSKPPLTCEYAWCPRQDSTLRHTV